MTSCRVVITPEAREDLSELRDYIAMRESKKVASQYLARLLAFCRGLAIAPYRGESRQGVAFGQRTIGFERRVTVVFAIQEQERRVNVVAFHYAGRISRERQTT